MTTPTIKKYLATIGARGGSSKSPAKVAAARKNGKLGGKKKVSPDSKNGKNTKKKDAYAIHCKN